MPYREPPAKGVVLADRRAKAVELKMGGATWDQVAEQCGYASRGHAHKDIQALLTERARELNENIESFRQEELEHLGLLRRKAMEILLGDHAMVSHGKVIYVEDPKTGERVALNDPAPATAAIAQLLRISERVGKLTGIDSPQRIETDTTIRYEIVGVDLAAMGVVQPPREQVELEGMTIDVESDDD